MKNILSFNGKPVTGKEIKDWIKYHMKHETSHSDMARKMEKFMNVSDDVFYHVWPSPPSPACGQVQKNRPIVVRECYFREDKMITPSDAWRWQPYENDQIKISVMFREFDNKECLVKIMSWGCDDFGMEQEFISNDYAEAYRKYEFWKNGLYAEIQDGVDVHWFAERGFYKS